MKKQDATSNSRFWGIGMQRPASASASSAKPPVPMEAITLSPGFGALTPSPTALTTPAISPPGANGSGGLNWYLSWISSTSGKLTPQDLTETSTWPLPGAGAGTSRSSSSSGGP